jgi:nucleotide-binding universal stress UspA family protein
MKIIAGTDFSSLAEHALESAFALAQRLGDSFEIVHVLEPPAVMLPELAVDGSQMMMSLNQASEQRLEATLARYRGRGVEVSHRTLQGVAEETLPGYAAEQKARLLALGTHGRKGAARFFIGSVSERIVRRAHVPILIVPENTALRSDDGGAATGTSATPAAYTMSDRRPLRVVAGFDVSPASDTALLWLRAFATATSCDLSLVHVYWPLRELARFGIEEIVDVHEGKDEVVSLLARELRPRINDLLGGVLAKLQLRPTLGRDADPLVNEAEAMDADLLVVGTNQRRDRWGGSTAIAAIRAAKRPVLCVPTLIEGMDQLDADDRAGRGGRRRSVGRALRTLLVPVDLSEGSRAAIAVAYQMLRASGGVLELLHVVRPTRDGLSAARVSELERHIGELVPADRQEHGIIARPHFAESVEPAQAILHAAERLQVDALVMASHRRTGIKHALGGSVAEHVFRDANKPVMLVPVAGEG